MPAKQTIAIIGAASAEGKTVIEHLLPANHRLLLMDEAAEQLQRLQQQLLLQQPLFDTDIQLCCREACWEADIIILAKAQPNLVDTLQKIREVSITKIVVCLLQYETQVQMQIEQYLPHSKIVFMLPNGELATQPVIAGTDNVAIETVKQIFSIANRIK